MISVWSLLYGIWGLDPATYHVTNVVFHVLNSLLVLLLLQHPFWFMLTRSSTAAGSSVEGNLLLAAAVGALLFALHPVQAEPVSWVSSLKDLCAAFFARAALILYCRQAGRPARYMR